MDNDQGIYDKRILDFVTIAAEFCAFLEQDAPIQRDEWSGKMLKILPLLYLKAQLLPDVPVWEEEMPELFVREEDYAHVAHSVGDIMGEDDVYLDVFVDEMKYSDTPVSATISENVADIYQDVRNFVSVYQLELEEQMPMAIRFCRESFHLYWGQKLVNLLRPLHALKYGEGALTDEENINDRKPWE